MTVGPGPMCRTMSEQCIQPINTCILCQRCRNDFQRTCERLHGQPFSPRLLFGGFLHCERSPHVISSTANHHAPCGGGKGRGAQGIVQTSDGFFHSDAIPPADVQRGQAGPIACVEHDAFTPPVQVL